MTPPGMQRLIVKLQKIEELVHHDIGKMEEEVGALFQYMRRQMVAEADLTLLVRQIERDPHSGQMGPSPHRHEANQLYCLLGDIEVEVIIENERATVKGSASILIPVWKTHAIRFISGMGFLVNVLGDASYR